MLNPKANHLSDEDILRFIDGETPAHQTAAAHQHLSDCPACSARQLRLEHSLAETTALLNPPLDTTLPDSRGGRAQLKAQLLQASQSRGEHWWRRLAIALHLQPHGLLYAGVAVMVLAVCAISWRGVISVRGTAASRYEQAALEPNRALTPGVTRPVTLADICPLKDDDLDPDVAPSKRKAVFDAYGIPPRASGQDYQVDYLINPQLGGTDDIRNLWPEPYTSVWNARAKDTLEKRLHQMVCERQIDLESAQRDIASDWIAAYKKYFRSEKPV